MKSPGHSAQQSRENSACSATIEELVKLGICDPKLTNNKRFSEVHTVYLLWMPSYRIAASMPSYRTATLHAELPYSCSACRPTVQLLCMLSYRTAALHAELPYSYSACRATIQLLCMPSYHIAALHAELPYSCSACRATIQLLCMPSYHIAGLCKNTALCTFNLPTHRLWGGVNCLQIQITQVYSYNKT